jgi:hypothetical protein
MACWWSAGALTGVITSALFRGFAPWTGHREEPLWISSARWVTNREISFAAGTAAKQCLASLRAVGDSGSENLVSDRHNYIQSQ